jgi:hypothetical protein
MACVKRLLTVFHVNFGFADELEKKLKEYGEVDG